MANDLSERIRGLAIALPEGVHGDSTYARSFDDGVDRTLIATADLADSAPLFSWRRVEDEEGDGPFLGWMAHPNNTYAEVYRDHQAAWRIVLTGDAAEGLTHVCDFHAPEPESDDTHGMHHVAFFGGEDG